MTSHSRLLAFVAIAVAAKGHDGVTTQLTWSREISRLILKHCASCHQQGGSSFPLDTFQQAKPKAKAIQEAVLQRRMPPYSAVKGFGQLRDDQALTQQQIELISHWVDDGAAEGDPTFLPKTTEKAAAAKPAPKTGSELLVNGSATLESEMTFAAVRPKSLASGSSVRVVAQRPDGTVEPLIWIYPYDPKFDRTYYFRRPLTFAPGTKILASSPGAIALLTAATSAQQPAR